MSAIPVLQFVLKRWKKDHNKDQEKNVSQPNRDPWWALLQGRFRTCHLRRQKARERESMEIKNPWSAKSEREERTGQLFRGQRPKNRVWLLSWAICWKLFLSTQSGMTTKLGLFKSGKLTLRCVIDRGQPVVLPQRGARPQQFRWNDETELELSVESRSFLNRVNDQVWKRQKRSSMNVSENGETLCDVGNVHVWNHGISSVHGKELPGQLPFHHELKRSHVETNVRHICKIGVWTRWDLWIGNNWLLVGKIIHGNICLWLVKKESSIFNAHRSTSFQILWCLSLTRLTPLSTSQPSSCLSSSSPSSTSTSSSRSSTRRSWKTCATLQSQIYWADWEKYQTLSQEEFFLCRCSTTFPVTRKAMKKNVWQMPRSSPSVRRSLVQDKGHLLVQVPRRNVLLRKRNSTQGIWDHNSPKANVQFSVLQVHCPVVDF